VNFGSTSSCTQCPAGYRNGGAATEQGNCQRTVAAGKYIKTAKDTTDTACANGYYKGEHTVNFGSTSTCTQCPAGYRNGTGTTKESNCQRTVAAGKYLKTAKATTDTACANGYYKEEHKVKYGSTSSCTQCPAGYRNGGAATEQGNCQRTVAAGKYLKTAKATTDTACANGYYKEEHKVKYGSTSSCTQCPSGYRNGTAAISESNCQRTVAAGKYLKTAKATTDTACANGYYKVEHKVNFGSTSSCTQCPAGYRNGGAATAESGCTKSVAKGKYVKTAKGDAINCPKGYYADTVRNVTYGNKNNCTQCPSGQVTLNEGSTSSSDCIATKKCYRPEYATWEITSGGTNYACEDSGCPTNGACAGCGWNYLIGDCGGDYEGSVGIGSTTYYYCNRIWGTCVNYDGGVHPCIVDYGSVYTIPNTQNCPPYYCESSPCKHGPHG
jgi:hypothetical protein